MLAALSGRGAAGPVRPVAATAYPVVYSNRTFLLFTSRDSESLFFCLQSVFVCLPVCLSVCVYVNSQQTERWCLISQKIVEGRFQTRSLPGLEREVEFSERVQRPPPHQLEGPGSDVSSPVGPGAKLRPPRAFGAFYCSRNQYKCVVYYQGLICVGTVGNAAPILIFRWERRSYSVPSLYPLGLYSSLNRQQSCH